MRQCRRHVPPLQGGRAAYEARRVDHQHELRQYRQAAADARTKGAIANCTAVFAQMLGKFGIRVNAVAPGSI